MEVIVLRDVVIAVQLLDQSFDKVCVFLVQVQCFVVRSQGLGLPAQQLEDFTHGDMYRGLFWAQFGQFIQDF